MLAARRIGLLTGKQFGRYEVRRMVGSGGMGAVYEARDTQLDRIVALKIPRGELVNDPVILQRFLNEARAAGAIRHPNICPIYDVGQLDGQHFITMPLVEGMSLSAWMEHRTVSLREAVELTRKLASALQAIHAVGIRHRDIKASNVMIDERGEPLLMDFGLARLAQTDTQLTQSGSLVGTPAYMAPEQIQLGASGGDERSDVYSLGVLLYQMLTGRLPFEGPMTRVLVDIATKTPPPVETLRPDVDADLANVCRKAMCREPSNRFQTAAEFETALQVWLNERSRHAPRDEPNVSTLPTASTTSNNQTTSTARSAPHAEREGYLEPPRRNRKATKFIAAAFLFTIAAAIVIKISDRAELVITSPEPGLEVKIVQLAQPEQERTLIFGKNSVRVRSGQVEVVLTGANADEYEVVGEKITLKRFGREVVEIKRRETGVAATPANVSSPSPITDEHLREVVRWVLSVGGSVEASFNGRFVRLSAAEAGKPLPEGKPVISTIRFLNANIRDDDLARLANLPDLQTLGLAQLPITDRGMELFGNLPKLKRLELDGLGLTEKALVTISHWTTLESLSLSQHEFTDVGVAPLAKLVRLQSLHAHNLVMTPAQTAVFRDLPELYSVWLTGEVLSDSTLENVAQLPKLTGFAVTFAEHSKITNAGVRHLAEKRKELEYVNLGGTAINDTALTDLSKLKKLDQLYLTGTKITDDGLASLSGLPKLKDLWIDKNRIGDRGVAALQSLKTLERLLLNDTDVTDAGLKHLTGLSRLKTLNLDGTKVSAEGVASLKKKLPNCNITAKHLQSPAPAIAPFTAEQAKQHQEAWAKYLDVPVEHTNSIGMKFRLIPPGEFLMGSTQREIDETISRLIPDDKTGPAFCRSESPQHKVVLTQPFYVGIYEVTQQDYETVLGTNPSQFSVNGPRKEAVAGMDTGKHPVELVQWRDAADFCAKLSAKEKLQPCYFKNGLEVTVLEGRNGYRFPTEAQWEFACRAGTTTKYWNGDTDEGLVQIGWFNRNSGDRTHAVGELNANPFGLYDVHGNVREYCQDWFDEEFYKTVQDKEAIDPLGPTRTPTSDHLVRGGGAQNNPTICRSASRHTARFGGGPGHEHIGFRVVLSVDAVRQTLASGNLAGDLDREVAWWVLAGGGHGEIKADVEGVNSTFDATEQLPNKPFAITDLYIHSKTLKAQDLEKLTGLSRLIRLRYVEVKIGDNLTRHIEGLTNLTYLQLNQCGLTDVGVERLGKLSKLEYLDLNWQPGITDRGLAVVQQMSRLGTLCLMSTSITDKGLPYLRQLPIEGLFMTGTKVTDAGMTTLAEVRSLEQLDLSVTSIGDEGVAQLASLPKLRMLALQKTALTDRGLKHLATVRSLQTLHVGGTKVTADGIASLRKALPNCKITDEPLPSEPPKPTVVATVAPSASPWDLLDPAQIPEAERVPRQPDGLVAVLGQHRRRVWNRITSSSVSPDGTQFTLTTDDGLYLFGRDPKQPARYFTFARGIVSATFLPDSKIAAFVHDEGPKKLQIFAKPRDGMPLEKQMATNAKGAVMATASSDGHWLAAFDQFESIGLWRLDDTSPQRTAKFVLRALDGNFPSLSFSPDAHWFCFTDNSQNQSTVHLIDLRGDSPREATVLKADADEKSDAPAKGFWQAVFLSDGRLATADKNGRTWLWKLNDGEPQRLGSIPDSGLLCAATDALRLFMYDSNGIWDLSVDPPKLLGTCPASFALDNIQSMVFSPDGTTFFTAHLNGAVRFWNVSPTGISEADPLLPNPGQFASEPFRIVDNLLLTTKESAPNSVGMWRPTRNGMQALPDLTDTTAVLDTSPARKLLAVAQPRAWGVNLLRRDGERWTPIRRIPGTNTLTAAIDSSGQRLAVCQDAKVNPGLAVELWGWDADDLPAKKLSSVNITPERAFQFAFAESGRTLIGRLGLQIQIWDVKEDQFIPRTLLPPRQIVQFAVAPDGNSLATVSHGGGLELWNLKSDLTQPTASFSFSGPFAVAFSPDGRRLAVSFWENGASAGVQIINLATGVVEKRRTFPGRVHELTFTDDSRHLITGNANATIYVVRLP